MQQKFHKRLSGGFQKLLTDIDLAAVRHTEGGILKIGSIFHIDDRTAATNKKARIFFERLGERFEALARSKRFAGSGADVDHVGEVLGGYNIPIAQTDVAAIHLHRQNRLRAGEFCEHFIQQTGQLGL